MPQPDPGLEAEGKSERAGGEVKKAAEKVAESAKGAVRGVRESDSPR